MKQSHLEQLIPLVLTFVTFLGLSATLYFFIQLLNVFPHQQTIVLKLNFKDILVGLTIYLKTSVDFGLFIGNVMVANSGMQKRIAIELGTALGNALGTLVILTIWYFTKEIPLLSLFMIALASLVLLKMAQDGLVEFNHTKLQTGVQIKKGIEPLLQLLAKINKLFAPFLRAVVPNLKLYQIKSMTARKLTLFSFTIPFILGLDDFAGYIPLFSVVNVFGFSVGVFLGHMLLNASLFLSPQKTVQAVRQPIIVLLGSLAFIGIALWGFAEVVKLILHILSR